MRANISIDVSLLAIILAMYFTKQDDRMILILVATLVAHVLATSNDESFVELGMAGTPGTNTSGVHEKDAPPLTEPIDESPEPSAKHFKTTVSSGVFDRNISTPQTQMTSSIFPRSSQEANGKLADARASFFKSLVS